MGFREQMIRILDYLPKGQRDGGMRQTLLFSATQTKRVADLAALSLHKPEYIGVHDKVTTGPTPESLQQSMVVVPLENKLDTVFSFIKSHLKKKSIIFFNSCSQIRHAYDLFCALQPGIPLLALHGKLKQEKRTKVYFDYMQRSNAVLFATDVAARGLDFKNVDWVVQADAPEDKDTYIHRVGRTARYTAGGKSLLILIPSEYDGMSKLLEEAKIPIKKLSINPKKTVVVSQKACGIVASKPELNGLAKKAYKSYLRSVYLMPNKEIFNVRELPFDDFATSLGLAATPSLRFLKALKSKDRDEIRNVKNVNYDLRKLRQEIKAEKLNKRLEKLGKSQEEIEQFNMKRKRVEDDDEDNILIVKKRHEWNDEDASALPDVDVNKVTRSRSDKRIRIEGSSAGENKRIVFKDNSDDEQDLEELDMTIESKFTGDIPSTNNLADANAAYMRHIKERLGKTKHLDRSEEKDRIREKHKKEKMKEKAANMQGDDEEDEHMMVTLGASDSSNASDDDSSSSNSEDSSDSESSDNEADDVGQNLKEKEDLALAFIHGKSS
jgi:ATP-dependent RNA helicase DDX10/DBP4